MRVALRLGSGRHRRAGYHLPAALLVLLLAGGAARGQTVLHLWHQMPPDSRELLKARIRVFERRNPDIRVMQLYKENEELRAGFQAAAAFTGGGPELVYGPSDFTGAFESMHILLPLERLFPPAFFAAFDSNGVTRYRGHIYQIGDEIGNHLALVWNRRLFADAGLDRAPSTLGELVAFGRRLTLDRNGDGVTDQYGLVWNYTEPFFFIPFYTSYGGWVMDARNRPTLDNAAARRAFTFVKALRDEARIIPRECDYEIADSKFVDGRAAMIINGAWAWGKYQAALGPDFALAVLPRNTETGLPCAPMVSCKGYFVNRSVDGASAGATAGAVRRFLRFMLSEETQRAFAMRLKTIPSLLALQRDPAILADPVIAVSLAQARVGRPSPLVPEMRAVWDAMRPPYQSLLGGNITADEAARQQQRLAEQKIRELNEGAGESPSGSGAVVAVLYALALLLAAACLVAVARSLLLPLLRKRATMEGRDARFALAMVVPAALLLFGVVLYPFLYNLVISLSNMSMLTVSDWRVIGFEQYGKVFGVDQFLAELASPRGTLLSAAARMFSTDFYAVLLMTVLWTVINVAFHVVIGVALAMLLNRPLPGKGLFRILLILPWAVPQYITALTWRGMFNTDSGAINSILKQVFAVAPLPWLSDATLAFAAAIITNIWLGFPFMMVIALGGLQSIPKELYEAAEIDGASPWQRFRNVTVPLLRPVMIPAITLGIVWTFNNINVIWLVSNGGQPADKTHILVSYVYRAAFNLYRYGYAAAFSFIIFLILAAFSITFMKKSDAAGSAY
jgi:arabinogalactan oligomer/maltooligosaccharide transport system permease protein